MNNNVHYGTFLGQFFPRDMEIANDRIDSVPNESYDAINSTGHRVSLTPNFLMVFTKFHSVSWLLQALFNILLEYVNDLSLMGSEELEMIDKLSR